MTSQNGEDTCRFKMQLPYAITLQISQVKLGNQREGCEGGREGWREGGSDGGGGGNRAKPGNQLVMYNVFGSFSTFYLSFSLLNLLSASVTVCETESVSHDTN